ncbi:hypothetical protein MRB53_041774 [Persea americana]|nr:hypothetical protein MRB53_041774 [Persea americana]
MPPSSMPRSGWHTTVTLFDIDAALCTGISCSPQEQVKAKKGSTSGRWSMRGFPIVSWVDRRMGQVTYTFCIALRRLIKRCEQRLRMRANATIVLLCALTSYLAISTSRHPASTCLDTVYSISSQYATAFNALRSVDTIRAAGYLLQRQHLTRDNPLNAPFQQHGHCPRRSIRTYRREHCRKGSFGSDTAVNRFQSKVCFVLDCAL